MSTTAQQQKPPAAAATPSSPPPPEVELELSPLQKLQGRLAGITDQANYGEMWGITLAGPDHAPTQVVLQKFLRANGNDVLAAERQLTAALVWRKKMQPAALVCQAFDRAKFADLGFVTVHKKDGSDRETVITWNIYGAVKDNKATFGDIQEWVALFHPWGPPPPSLGTESDIWPASSTYSQPSFLQWRTALMELGVQKLRLGEIEQPVPDGAEDPYQMLQVHDYRSVSFFRMDPAVKAASKETIQALSTAYPELLAHKYFVNVPAIMGWMFGAMKLFLSPVTLRKFHPMSSGTTLAAELPSISSTLPKEYGGGGGSVREGLSLRLADEPAARTGELANPSSSPTGDDTTEVKKSEVKGETEASPDTPSVKTTSQENEGSRQAEETVEAKNASKPGNAKVEAEAGIEEAAQ